MVTIRASEQGLIQVDQVRRRRGWDKQSAIWYSMVPTSRATLKRFWRGEAIEQGTFIAICQAVGITDWEAIAESDDVVHELLLCLDTMPDVPLFFGRTDALAHLTNLSSQCRVIVIWGFNGIGKTSLVVEWIESFIRSGAAENRFEVIFWRSLQYNPSLEILTRSLAEQCNEDPETPILTVLQRHSVLLILDNWEALLGGASAGTVAAEFDGFSYLLQKIGLARHNSCVIVISCEKPSELALLEGKPSIQSYKLAGMEQQDAFPLLQHRGLPQEPAAWETLIQLYRGNPLALNMIASLIQDVCQGSAAKFLEMKTIVVHKLDNVLAERIRCLPTTELKILRILAQIGQPTSRESLYQRVSSEMSQSQLLEIVLSLERRCLLEILSAETTLFALAPIIQKYVN
ncbi:MAG: NACHT domain-containing protein [Rhizonema sp. PD38]|nr:NACHT domain-containing protein [Rhizonema sp. PD38]